jgi:hypothetical protein
MTMMDDAEHNNSSNSSNSNEGDSTRLESTRADEEWHDEGILYGNPELDFRGCPDNKEIRAPRPSFPGPALVSMSHQPHDPGRSWLT